MRWPDDYGFHQSSLLDRAGVDDETLSVLELRVDSVADVARTLSRVAHGTGNYLRCRCSEEQEDEYRYDASCVYEHPGGPVRRFLLHHGKLVLLVEHHRLHPNRSRLTSEYRTVLVLLHGDVRALQMALHRVLPDKRRFTVHSPSSAAITTRPDVTGVLLSSDSCHIQILSVHRRRRLLYISTATVEALVPTWAQLIDIFRSTIQSGTNRSNTYLALFFLDMQQGFIVGCFVLFCTVFAPTVWHQWIYSRSANANFYFGVTLAFAIAQIFLLTDILFASVKHEFAVQHGINKKVNGNEAKLLLE